MNRTTDTHQTTVDTYVKSVPGLAQTQGIQEVSFYPGQKIPGFTDTVYVEKLSDKGGLGTIHKVYDRDEDTYYAMKIPKLSLPKDAKRGSALIFARRIFTEEAKRLSSLPPHRNIVKPIHFVEWDDKLCLFMELIEGYTLDEIIYNPSSLRVDPARQGSPKEGYSQLRSLNCSSHMTLLLAIFIEICRGMDFAYQQTGLIHLDLTPFNVLWNRQDGAVKIVDFGLSRVVYRFQQALEQRGEGVKEEKAGSIEISSSAEATFYANMTAGEAGSSLMRMGGTLPYMAPEQFRGFDYCDTRSPIYSLGVVMYELVTGNRLFTPGDSEDPFRAYEKLHREEKVSTVPNCDKRLERIILRCLSKEPSKRYQTFAELLTVLESLYEEITGMPYEPPDPIEPTVDELQNRSVMYSAFGDYTKGLEFAEKALAIDPDHTGALLSKCYALRGLMRFKEALSIVKSLLQKEPDNDWALSLAGVIYFDSYEYEKGIELFETQKQLGATVAMGDLMWNLASCYIGLKRYVEAQLCLDEGLAYMPQDRHAFLQTLLFVESGQGEKALDFLQPLLATDWNGEVHNALGFSLRRLSRNKEAIIVLQGYLKINPEAHSVWIQLGLVFGEGLGQNEEAIKCFRKGLELKQGDANAAANLILSLVRIGRADEALNFGNAWKEKYQPHACFWNSLGNTKHRLRDYEEAITCYRNALELFPAEATTAGNLINSLRQLGRPKEAVAFGNEWLNGKSSQPNSLFLDMLIGAFSELNRYDEIANGFFRKALELLPSYDIAITLIRALYKMDRVEEGVTFFNAWKEKHHTSEFGWNQLGLVNYEFRQYEQASLCYRKSLELMPSNATVAGKLIASLCQMERAEEAVAFGSEWLKKYQPNADFIKELKLAEDLLPRLGEVWNRL